MTAEFQSENHYSGKSPIEQAARTRNPSALYEMWRQILMTIPKGYQWSLYRRLCGMMLTIRGNKIEHFYHIPFAIWMLAALADVTDLADICDQFKTIEPTDEVYENIDTLSKYKERDIFAVEDSVIEAAVHDLDGWKSDMKRVRMVLIILIHNNIQGFFHSRHLERIYKEATSGSKGYNGEPVHVVLVNRAGTSNNEPIVSKTFLPADVPYKQPSKGCKIHKQQHRRRHDRAIIHKAK